ncbi:MAG: M3 family metallopeptidase [Gammaproteobacteria bacterium]|nr:M3 family metallopeptidase [Gammaproteobacteria bacterium]
MKRLSSAPAYWLLPLILLALVACTPKGNETAVDELESKENVMTDDVAQPDGAADLKVLEQTVSIGPISLLPVWEEIEAKHVEPGIRTLLAEVDAAFAKLESEHSPTWSGLMEPLERLEKRLDRTVGVISHLRSVKYTDELQSAYDTVRPAYVELTNRMNQSRAVYEGMVAIRQSDAFTQFSLSRQRILTESIAGMERAGVHLEGAAKTRYQEITQKLSQLSNDFSANLVKEEKQNRVRVTDVEQIAGVPEALLTLAAKRAEEDGVADATTATGPWHFVVNGVNYTAVLQHATDRSLREEFYRAFRARGTTPGFDNREIVAEIITLRQEQAALVGFTTYADLSLAEKMAPDTEAVWALLHEIETAARPAAEREYSDLLDFMLAEGAAAAENPEPWDMGFWVEKLRTENYDYDSEALREYFQMPRVLDGLFTLTRKLYGVEIRRSQEKVPVWDESVEFFEVRKDNEIIAGFYMDPYARAGEKRGGAWMNTVVDRSRAFSTTSSSMLPVALFVMNVRPPVDDGPALMSMDEVRTLFHEFGHATQHMFTNIEEGGASGMNLVEWDAVELASQFNEYWMDYKPFLRNLTSHFETDKPLDEATLDRIIESRNFMIGTATQRQLWYAKTDMALHERYGRHDTEDGATPFDIEQELAQTTIVTPMLPGESTLPAFGHLFSGGYAAGYYSYKWAEVLAADAFGAFKEVGLDNEAEVRNVAERFRDTVLGLGGSLPAREVYRQFRGRDATPDALLEDQGLR